MSTHKKQVDSGSDLQSSLNISEKGNNKKPKIKKIKKTDSTLKPNLDDGSQESRKISMEDYGAVNSDSNSLNDSRCIQNNRGPIFLGGGLLLIGVILFIGNLIEISFWGVLWPFVFIVPGLLVFLSALSSERNNGEGLSILGAILLSFGLILFLQSVAGLWATWAYIWALIVPTSIGAAQMIYGKRKGRSANVESGKKLVKIGIIIFAAGFIFFELIIGINGFGLRRLGLPVIPSVLIIAGIIIMARALTKK